jgi:hypothetical protein
VEERKCFLLFLKHLVSWLTLSLFLSLSHQIQSNPSLFSAKQANASSTTTTTAATAVTGSRFGATTGQRAWSAAVIHSEGQEAEEGCDK